MKKTLSFVVLLALFCTPALAVDIFLNGVKITGLSDQTIDGAKVVLDKQGNVHITATDYKVRELAGATTTQPTTQPTPPPVVNPANLQQQYFVITEVSKPGVTGYKVQLIVNNKFIKDLPDTIAQNVVELNPYLVAGDNTVSFRALRPAGAVAKSTLATDTFALIIGQGKAGDGGQLTISDVLAEFKVAATDSGEKSKSFALKAK
ncbi:MAG: hypothetical protein JRF33_21370 [Deltaproteobacteria bacterium]|nr:hypothetical protein [Deltaproteobacteria bacterium]